MTSKPAATDQHLCSCLVIQSVCRGVVTFHEQISQMVMGPAGTGKSTYCKVMQEHCQNARRTVHVVNLDPAAEAFEYEVAFDIRGNGRYRVASSFDFSLEGSCLIKPQDREVHCTHIRPSADVFLQPIVQPRISPSSLPGGSEIRIQPDTKVGLAHLSTSENRPCGAELA